MRVHSSSVSHLATIVCRLFPRGEPLSSKHGAGPKLSEHMLIEDTGLLHSLANCLSQLSHKDVQHDRMPEVSKNNQLMQLPSYLQHCVRCESVATSRGMENIAV